MLKLMIVDDEVIIREGLKKSFDWNSLGYEIVAESDNGIDAIDLYYETLPDVIITDIYMQSGNGLEFIKSLKKANSRAEIVVLSGYPNFEYAQTAINNGVFAYLLKPVSSSELIDVMTKIKDKLLNQYNSNTEMFLSSLLLPTSLDKLQVEKLIEKYNVFIPDSPYIVIALQIDSHGNDDSLIYENLTHEISSNFNRKNIYFTCKPRAYHLVVLMFYDSTSVKNLIYMAFSSIKDNIQKKYNATLSIGISSGFSDILKVRDAYLQALFCLSQKALYGIGSIISYENNIIGEQQNSRGVDTLTTILTPTTDEIKSIITGVNSLNRTVLDDTLKSYFNRIKNLKYVNINALKNTISEMALQIIYVAAPDPELRRAIFGEKTSPISDIAALDMIEDIEKYIENLIVHIFNHHVVTLAGKNSSLIRDIQIYIMTNYPLQISIDTIANEFHVTRHHLMRIFKKETGQTINEFLTNYRINIALALFNDGNLSVLEVAQQVGYQDANYFSKIFKKITGVSPSKYNHKE